MIADRSRELGAAVDGVYAAFAGYRRPAAVDFCSFCYREGEISYLRSTALRELDAEHVRQLAWESADHWESTAVYKHYLPRILDALAPPALCDDMYEEHLFEVLTCHRFLDWPAEEQRAVVAYVAVVAGAHAFESPAAEADWRTAAAALGSG